MLQQDVVAQAVDEGPQALGLPDAALAAQGGKDPHECFLPNILDGLRRMQPGTQLELDQFAEISDKMLLRAEVSCSKTLKVGFVKGLELQGPALASAGVAASVADANRGQ